MAKEIKLMENVSSEGNGSDVPLDTLRLFGNYPGPLLDFATACCVIFMLVGIPGNLITIISLARYKKVRNATAIFIINLSCSDFLFCCINLPLAASTFATRSWPHGEFMCRFFPFARYALAAVSLFTVLAITTNRYIMISHPRLYIRLFTKRNLGIIIAWTWIFAFGMLLPVWLEVWGRFGMNPKSGLCCVIPDHDGHTPMKVIFGVAFFVPFFTISISYMRIFFVVRKATNNSRATIRGRPVPEREESSFASTSRERSPNRESTAFKPQIVPPEHPRIQSLRVPPTPTAKISISLDSGSSKSTNSIYNIGRTFNNLRKSQFLDKACPSSKDKRLLTMISAIMITFFVCHLPITVIKLLDEITTPSPSAVVWSYLLRFLTTCVNPIIYVVISNEYRKAYKKGMVLPSCKGKTCKFWR